MTRTMTTSKGQTFETTFTDGEAIERCQRSSSTFAQDLARQAARRPLSFVQLVWAHYIAVQDADRARAAADRDSAARRDARRVGDLAGLLELFRRSADHLKYPAVRLQITRTVRVKVYPCGPRSKYQGSIAVVAGDADGNGNRAWYGRVTPDGDYLPAGNVPPADRDAIGNTLARLAADPAAVAAEHGRLTGHCCFCDKALDDERSTEKGYGPICAKHWGLPWGDTGTRSRGPARRPAVADDHEAQIAAAELANVPPPAAIPGGLNPNWHGPDGRLTDGATMAAGCVPVRRGWMGMTASMIDALRAEAEAEDRAIREDEWRSEYAYLTNGCDYLDN